MKVHEVIGFGLVEMKTGVLLGLECETEGHRLPQIENAFWNTVPDGSLRNGLEYVSKPLKETQVGTALTKLHKEITDQGGQVDYSFRCSTHVHINVLDLDHNQLMSMIFLYMMYENVFMNFVAEERVGNRFCLRFQDAQYLTSEVSHFFQRTRQGNLAHAIGGLRQERLKYAGFNLYTLRKYGTLEFRALEGTNDRQKILNWVKAIIALRTVSTDYNDPVALYNDFLADPGSFAEKLFGHAPEAFLKDGWRQQVEEGYSQNLAVLMSL